MSRMKPREIPYFLWQRLGPHGQWHAANGIRAGATNQETGLIEQGRGANKLTHGLSAESPCVNHEAFEGRGLGDGVVKRGLRRKELVEKDWAWERIADQGIAACI